MGDFVELFVALQLALRFEDLGEIALRRNALQRDCHMLTLSVAAD